MQHMDCDVGKTIADCKPHCSKREEDLQNGVPLTLQRVQSVVSLSL